ncbi:MAG: carboxypeptidase regulatory-like domain-containing protein [Planctomycetota bacterium]
MGQTLRIRNSDPILHNIRWRPIQNDIVNFPQSKQGQENTRSFRRPEVMVRIGCDVHGWMEAFAGVLDHPFFAVTGADGSFEIAGLPPGTHVLEAWHEQLGTVELTVELAARETKAVEIEFPAKR